MTLPADYLSFAQHHGPSGFVGNEYLILWKPEELTAINKSYQVEKYAPGLLIFGSNGGGEAYGFDTRDPLCPIVKVPFIVINWEDAIPMGNTFTEFLQLLRESA